MADKFLRGAMILTMAGLMVKILGSVKRCEYFYHLNRNS